MTLHARLSQFGLVADAAGEISSLPPLLQPLYAEIGGALLFNDALRIFPLTADARIAAWTLGEWNEDALWKHLAWDRVHKVLFFAEDALAWQFGVIDAQVVMFNPEYAELEVVAESVEGWIDWLLADVAVRTGNSLLQAFCARFGVLAVNERLSPLMPFSIGGDYIVDNVAAADSADTLAERIRFGRSIEKFPEGTWVEVVARTEPDKPESST